MRIKFFLLLMIILISSILLIPKVYASCLEKKAALTFDRLYLNISSTPENLQYFQCTITLNQDTLTERYIPLRFVPVKMVNYGQMISGFNGWGIFDTTAEYINSYTFSAYHDPKAIYKNKSGFVDVFVAWPAYAVTCKIVKGPSKDKPILPNFG